MFSTHIHIRALAVIAASVLSILAFENLVSAQQDKRDRLPIVIRGMDLPWVNSGVPISEIYLYRYNGDSVTDRWDPIPFQIDKRREVNVLHNLLSKEEFDQLDPESQADVTDLCVYSYFSPETVNSQNCASWSAANGVTGIRNCPDTYQSVWNDPQLLPRDEIVFMARDVLAGSRDACPRDWLVAGGAPGLSDERLEIQIPNGEGEFLYVYAYRWTSPPPSDLRSSAPVPAFSPEECSPCAGANAPANAQNICGTISAPNDGSLPG